MFVLTSQIAMIFAGERNLPEHAGTKAQNTRMYSRHRIYTFMLPALALLVLMLYNWSIQDFFACALLILLTGLRFASIPLLFSMHGKTPPPMRSACTFSHYAVFVFVTFALALSAFHSYSNVVLDIIENPTASNEDLSGLSDNFFVRQNNCPTD